MACRRGKHCVACTVPCKDHWTYPDPQSPDDVAATTSYGIDFCCAVARGSMVATQFHPEKSGALGLRLYRNFVALASRMAA